MTIRKMTEKEIREYEKKRRIPRLKKKLRNLFNLRKLLKPKVSEELYLLGIAIVFFSLSLFLGIEIWGVHNELFESPLATDIFTSSIFLVLTIFFLSWLAKVRDNREWSKVKRSVYRGIEKIIYGAAQPLMYVSDDKSTNMLVPLLKFDDETNSPHDFFAIYSSKSHVPLTSLYYDEDNFRALCDPAIRRHLLETEHEISRIIDAYLRLLPAEIIEPLIKLQDLFREIVHKINSLSNTIKLYKELEDSPELKSQYSSFLNDESTKTIHQQLNSLFEQTMSEAKNVLTIVSGKEFTTEVEQKPKKSKLNIGLIHFSPRMSKGSKKRDRKINKHKHQK
jgi:hypothetical protein